jgi:Secretion system C-terminal sorting domain
VGYTIRLQTRLPHLTTIRNKADIIFDVNAPIVTPTWTNTVDRVPPVSRVTHIARTARDTVFTVHWTGVDPHAGILDYTVYVSENGNPFMEWLANTSSDSAQFIGTRGRIYDFYVRARDYVGNIETKLPLAEASTGRVSTEPVPVAANWLGQNRPNPSSGTTQIDFYLAEYASKVQLDVYNLAGIKVKTVLNHAFASGLHTVMLDLKGWPTGIYFYRLETDLFNETKRMLIVD